MNNLFGLRSALGSFFALSLSLASLSCGSTSFSATGSPGDAGTGQGSPDGTTGGGGTPLPCDVNAIVQAKCQLCHGPTLQSGAPMHLVTWEDFQAVTPTDSVGPSFPAGQPVYKTAQTRINATTLPMPQPPTTLTDAEKATLNTWLAAGAPKTDGAVCAASDGGGAPDAAGPALTCTSNNVTIKAASAWTMPTTDVNDYVCYSVPVPAAGTGINHILGITPNVDNHKIVHHILLFQAAASDTSITSTPQPCNAGGSLTWRIVYGWAPGGTAMTTPPNVGFPYDANTKWVVQVHYNNVNGLAGETDSSGFSFCTTDQPVANDADVVAFGTQNIKIPAHSQLDQTCNTTVSSLFAGVHVFAAFPHMHTLGQAIQTEQHLAGGGIVTMGENVPWDFNTQLWFPLQTTLNLGDVVSTRCSWTNTTGSEVNFGQNTENEMCYSFTAYYPRVTSAAWSWALPALTSTCSTSPDGGLPTPDAGWLTDASFGDYTDASAGD